METSNEVKKSSDPSDLAERLKGYGQIVLVLQGGGALGAYQAGVYEALHEAGIEPAWVIGTSIGAIHAGIIAGNPPESRLEKVNSFWMQVAHENPFAGFPLPLPDLPHLFTMFNGIRNFCVPNPLALMGSKLAAQSAAYYLTGPLKATLNELIDFTYVKKKSPRLTVGAANIHTSTMNYFDSRDVALDVRHVMASGALPPAFPPVLIDDELYWDGGVLSNTPCEVIFDDRPRRDSLVISVDIWDPAGPGPDTMGDVVMRQQEIQYSSRLVSHIKRQKQIHRLRHIISDLGKRLPEEERNNPSTKELTAYGCVTHMHFVQLIAPRIEGENAMKGIDFTAKGIRARWQAGKRDMNEVLARRPWEGDFDPLEGLYLHGLRD